MRRTKAMMMGELLEDFFSRPWVAAKVAEGRLPEVWRECVGDLAADQTTHFELRGRILNVRIASSVLRNELFLRRAELCDELNRRSKVPLIEQITVK